MQHGRKRSGRRSSAKIIGASRWQVDPLETRMLLSAVIAPADPAVSGSTLATPLAPKPGHSFYVSGLDASGTPLSQWANTSAITPYTTSDLVLNVSPSSQSYTPCCEGANSSVGSSLLTNGLTQSQTAPAPSAGAAAVGSGGASDPSNSTNTISANGAATFTYTLGSAGGATPSGNGYDISEIDLLSGHQDTRTGMFNVDILVQPVGGDQFLSLSGGAGFSLTTVPDGAGGFEQVQVGSLQMAIVNSTLGQAITQHAKAIEFEILDPSSFYRELVVTGTPSGSSLSSSPSMPTNVSASYAAGFPTLSWNASSNAVGYSILRSTNFGGNYVQVGSVASQTTFQDSSALPNSSYFYEVVASGNGDSPASTPAAANTPTFGAAAYFYQQQLWQGSPAISEDVPLINYAGGPASVDFPLTTGFIANSYSTLFEGKITTDLAGAYTFVAPTDDDGYLWVDGRLVSEQPGLGISTRHAATSTPITLAANTSYGFVYLENNRTGAWSMKLQWQEPTAGGSAGPVTVIPANHLSPAVDAPAVPAKPTVAAGANDMVTVSWSAAGDTSSYGYVVERAAADSSGTPTGAFFTVGQAFSGPTVLGANGAAAWGATSFVDTTAAANTEYVYRVGPILPNETMPPTLSATSLPITPSGSGGSSDLSATISGKLPATIIAGQKVAVSQSVALVDSSVAAVKGIVRADLYLSASDVVDINSVHLVAISKKVSLKSHGRTVLNFKVPTLSASTTPGAYHLVVQITDSNGSTFDAATLGTINVAAPQIDLSGSFAKGVTPGKNGKTPLTFNVKNGGNVAAVGSLMFNIDTSTDGSLASATTLKKKVNLKPGKSLRVTANVTLLPGTYFVLVQIDPNNAFKDVDLTNNLIVSNGAVTVE